MAASRELKRDEIVLMVPRSALLTTENVLLRDPNLASSFQNHRRHLSPTQVLSHPNFNSRVYQILIDQFFFFFLAVIDGLFAIPSRKGQGFLVVSLSAPIAAKL